MEVAKEMEKLNRSYKCCILWLAYQEGKIFDKFKAINKFINLGNNFGMSKSTMAFEILISIF